MSLDNTAEYAEDEQAMLKKLFSIVYEICQEKTKLDGYYFLGFGTFMAIVRKERIDISLGNERYAYQLFIKEHCPHCVIRSNYASVEEYAEVQRFVIDYCSGIVTRDFEKTEGKGPSRYKYCFSDADSAMHFRLRF